MLRSLERGHDWAIVLAGGSGTRLTALARDDRPVPKQYCSLRGGRSLLAGTLERAGRLVPREHIVVVVAAEHAEFWCVELAHLPPCNVIVQPENRGTAPGVLLPLLAILDRDPEARVVLLPSDHFVDREAELARVLRRARADVEELLGWVMLLGIEPTAEDHDHGWIVPGPGTGTVRPVAAFVEKPQPHTARELLAQGAVWNSFLMVARATTLLRLYAARLPHLLAAFRQARPHLRPRRAMRLYERLHPSDFSRDVLTGSEVGLRLRTVPDCGWTDLGTPERIRQCLRLLPPEPARQNGRGCQDLASLVAPQASPTRPPTVRVAQPLGVPAQ